MTAQNNPNTDAPIPMEETPAVSHKIKHKMGFISIETKLNIFTLDMAREVITILHEMINNPKVKVIILKTAGTRVFSAGWDLAFFKNDLSMEKIWDVLDVGGTIIETIMMSPKPTVVRVTTVK